MPTCSGSPSATLIGISVVFLAAGGCGSDTVPDTKAPAAMVVSAAGSAGPIGTNLGPMLNMSSSQAGRGVAGGAALQPSAARPPSTRGAAGMAAASAGAVAVAPPMQMQGQAAAAGGAAMSMSMGPGTAPAPGNADLSRCPAPPAGAPADAVAALNATNTARLKTGAGCMSLQVALNQSATSHCAYNASNTGNAMCQAGGHNEVMSCMGFTGADVAARVKAAGYMGRAGVTEVLTQGGTPEQAVMGWIGTLWHRIPMLDPWTTDMGWGSADGCRIIDFGAGMNPAPKELVTVYPYDGQTDYPVSFNGLESPQPPAPPGGFPSSSMISVYAQNIQVTEHVLTKDGDATPIEHIWIDKNSPEVMAGYRYYLNITSFIYGHKPFEPNTKYRVKVVGTHTGGPLNLEWTFTTGAAARNPWGT